MTVRRGTVALRSRASGGGGPVTSVPGPELQQDDESHKRQGGEPDQARSAMIDHHESCQQRSDRRAEIASDLKEGLRRPEPPARGGAGNARGFGVEDGRTHSDQRGPAKQPAIGRPFGEQHDAAKGHRHPEAQRMRHRATIRKMANDRLQDRSRNLKRQGDQADLPEQKTEFAFDHRIARGDERLDHVVQAMTKARAEYDDPGRRRCGLIRRDM
jgi:hypothetical protein